MAYDEEIKEFIKEKLAEATGPISESEITVEVEKFKLERKQNTSDLVQQIKDLEAENAVNLEAVAQLYSILGGGE